MKSHYFILFVLFVLVGCNPDDDNQPPTDAGFTQSDFPVGVGNYWYYKATNEQNDTIDTLRVEVISSVDSANATKYLCEISLGGVVVDSSFISVSSTKLEYIAFNPEVTFFADFKLQFPFRVGDSWNGTTPLDSVTVVAALNEDIINGIAYAPVYELDRNLDSFGFHIDQTFKVTPGIGIINQHVEEFTGANLEKRNFELIDYHIN